MESNLSRTCVSSSRLIGLSKDGSRSFGRGSTKIERILMDYPRWKYHAKEKPTIVNSLEEEKLLGKGWENSPAYFDKQEKKETEEVIVEEKKKGKKN